ncbi:MAG: hypothetical protein GY881_00815, partial [Gammaproteobacteria bacterium]|nr:hypothetical protein [Gammaproteobacteria bacterium]
LSCKEYTPTAAELWTLNGRDEVARPAKESAYATTWYDQSGSGNDATQSTLTQQPLLVRAGVTNTDGQCDSPALAFDGVNDYLDATGVVTANGADDTSVFVGTATNIYRQFGFLDNISENAPHYIGNNGGRFGVYFGAVGDIVYNPVDTNQNLHYISKSSTAADSYASFNGVVDPLDAGTDGYAGGLRIGASRGNTGIYLEGNMQEAIVYPTDESANRIGIEENVADGWCMPYPTQPIVSDYMPTPAAGYSLRSLTGSNSETVVKLRRASDNAESDFTAA